MRIHPDLGVQKARNLLIEFQRIGYLLYGPRKPVLSPPFGCEETPGIQRCSFRLLEGGSWVAIKWVISRVAIIATSRSSGPITTNEPPSMHSDSTGSTLQSLKIALLNILGNTTTNSVFSDMQQWIDLLDIFRSAPSGTDSCPKAKSMLSHTSVVVRSSPDVFRGCDAGGPAITNDTTQNPIVKTINL